ncbi:hypothetical protein Mboo_0889 [Methanoregula boonei 6A8]|uniref:Uncharacterized protein n=1 Tax=Methanoregula boonei (strain DSM 21154 / JCM 14090 / 6A8) TaxID=456442 RepID=A7I6P6_METB6|nr:hypothetical protein Mboo_0889 [Methanoregula boonei 6A8]
MNGFALFKTTCRTGNCPASFLPGDYHDNPYVPGTSGHSLPQKAGPAISAVRLRECARYLCEVIASKGYMFLPRLSGWATTGYL